MYETFVVNLDKDTKKWNDIQARAPWPLTRFSAVQGKLVENRPWYMNHFMIGCLLSHRALWHLVAQQSEPCLILEDDCLFCTDFQQQVKTVMQSVPADYDIAMQGYIASDVSQDVLLASFAYPLMKRRNLKRVNDVWFVPGMCLGSHCYLLTPAGARKLVKNTNVYHADCVLNRDTSLRLYCPCQPLATQVVRGNCMYSESVSWEWLASEPVMGVGPMTLRVVHLIALYIALLLVLQRSKNATARNMAFSLQLAPVMQYIRTRYYIEERLLL
jgi:GR25 family glycosyltransferase involved in LPS biosynthesis